MKFLDYEMTTLPDFRESDEYLRETHELRLGDVMQPWIFARITGNVYEPLHSYGGDVHLYGRRVEGASCFGSAEEIRNNLELRLKSHWEQVNLVSERLRMLDRPCGNDTRGGDQLS